MKPRITARYVERPRHVDRPKQWVHTPWLLLGMLFVTALLMASHRVSPAGDGSVPPAGHHTQAP